MSDSSQPPVAYRTAADVAGQSVTTIPAETQGDARNGLTRVLGLQEIPGSSAPSRFDGQPVPHVFGPGQNPVDAVAAGLDTRLIGYTADTLNVVTKTGEAGSGMRPHTYVEKTGPEMVKQAAEADGQNQPTPPAPQLQSSPQPVPQPESKVSDQPVPTNGGDQSGKPVAKKVAG